MKFKTLDPVTKPVLEKDIQREIVKMLKENNFSVDVITKGMYGANGIADIICCKDGKYIAIEVKRPKNYPTPLQAKWLKDKREAGAVAFVAYGVEDTKNKLKYFDLL